MASAELVVQDNQSGTFTVAGVAEPRSDSVDWKTWGLLVLPFLLCALGLAIVSDGNYHEDDTTHYLMSRGAWQAPEMFLSVWGRPGFTIPYAFVAWIGGPYTGLLLCRLLSLLVALATAALTTATAKRLRIPHSEWAGLITFLIPLYFQLSFATLTETICGLYLMGSTFLLVSNRPKAAALVLSLTMLTRHEAIVFVVGGMILFFWRREWIAGLLVWAAEVVWNAVTALTIGGRLPWLRYQPGSDMGYGTGSIAWGLLMWVEAVGPVVLLLTLWGSWVLLRRVGSSPDDGGEAASTLPRGLAWLDGRNVSPLDIGRVLIVCGALGTVLLNTLLYMFNKFASGGYARFLVPAAPWMAVCTLEGINVLLRRIAPWFDRSDPQAAVPRLRRAFVVTVLMCFGMTLTALLLGVPRFILAIVVSVGIASGVLLGGASIGFLGTRLRRPGLARFGALLMALAWPIAWSGGVMPLRQTATQHLYAEACNWIKEHPRFSELDVASVWPTGDIYVWESGLRGTTIQANESPSKPLLVLRDTTHTMDLHCREWMERVGSKELVRFQPAAAGILSAPPEIIVYMAGPAPETAAVLPEAIQLLARMDGGRAIGNDTALRSRK